MLGSCHWRRCVGSGTCTVSLRCHEGQGECGSGHTEGSGTSVTPACVLFAHSLAHARLCTTHSKEPACVQPASSKSGRYASIGQPEEDVLEEDVLEEDVLEEDVLEEDTCLLFLALPST